MATHHQKLHPLDQPITKRQAVAMVQKVILAFEARLQKAGIPPLEMPEHTSGYAHVVEEEADGVQNG